ncbi:MAG: diacylglycerol kinase [Parvularculales bacterium]
MNKKNPDTGLKRILSAFGHALDGLKEVFTHETSFRQEVLLAGVSIPLVFWLEVDTVATALMIGSIFLILIAELANSAIESVVDRISLEQHALSKRAKDTGSAMVLVSFINAMFVWGIILAG